MSARVWLRDRPGRSAETTGFLDTARQIGGSSQNSPSPQKGRRTPKRRAVVASTEEATSIASSRRPSSRQNRRGASSQDAEPDAAVAEEEEAVRGPAEEGGGAGGEDKPFCAGGGRDSCDDAVSPREAVVWKPHGAEGHLRGVALALEAQGRRQRGQEEAGRGVGEGARAAGGRTLSGGNPLLIQGAAGVPASSHERAVHVLEAAGIADPTSPPADASAPSCSRALSVINRASRPAPAAAAAPSSDATGTPDVAAATAVGGRATSSGAAIADAAGAAGAPGSAEAGTVDLTGDEGDDVTEVFMTLPSRPKRRYGTGHPAPQGTQARGGSPADSAGAGSRRGSRSGARAGFEVVDLDQEDEDCKVLWASNQRGQKRRGRGSGTHAALRDGGGSGTQTLHVMDSPEDGRQPALAAGERVNRGQQQGAASHTSHRPPHPTNRHRSRGNPPNPAAAQRPVPAEPRPFPGSERPAPPAGPPSMPVASHSSGSADSTQGQGAASLGSRLGWPFPGTNSIAGGAASLFSAASAAAAAAGFGATRGTSGEAGQSNHSMFGQPRAPLPFGNGSDGSLYAQGTPGLGGPCFPSGGLGLQPGPQNGGPVSLGTQQASPSGAAGGLNIKCPICLDTISEETTTTCGHLFCKPCIALAVQTKKCCPTCRRKLGKSGYHRVYLS